eukprot:g63095.t1
MPPRICRPPEAAATAAIAAVAAQESQDDDITMADLQEDSKAIVANPERKADPTSSGPTEVITIDSSTSTTNETVVRRVAAMIHIVGVFMPQSLHWLEDPPAQTVTIDGDLATISLFLGLPSGVLRLTKLVHTDARRQYMIELIRPQLWQDLLSTLKKNVVFTEEKATMLLGQVDKLPRTISVESVKLGDVTVDLDMWAWFLSVAGKENLAKPDTHLRLGKILRFVITVSAIKAYIRFVYPYYSQATGEVEAASLIEHKDHNPAAQGRLGRLPRHSGQNDRSDYEVRLQVAPAVRRRFTCACIYVSSIGVICFQYSVIATRIEGKGTRHPADRISKSKVDTLMQTNDSLKSETFILQAQLLHEKSVSNRAASELAESRKKIADFDASMSALKTKVAASESEDELATAMEEIQTLNKTISNKERQIRDDKKKVLAAKKGEAQEGVEERDNLLIEAEDFKAQANFHKEQGDKLAKDLAETKRENETLLLKVESTFLVLCVGVGVGFRSPEARRSSKKHARDSSSKSKRERKPKSDRSSKKRKSVRRTL